MKQKQSGFAHIQIVLLAVVVFSVIGFAAFRIGQASNNREQSKDLDTDTSLAQDITIKEDAKKEVAVPAEKETASQEKVATTPKTTTTTEPKKVTEETKKEDKVWLKMEQVSAQQTGSFLNIVSRLPSPQSGKCNFKLVQSGYEKVYTFTSISSSTDCAGSLDVSNLPIYSGWELHVWFDSFDGKTQASQKEAPISIVKPN